MTSSFFFSKSISKWKIFIFHDKLFKSPPISSDLNDNLKLTGAFLVAQWQRTCLPTQKMWVQSLGREDSLEKETATHASTLVWKTP